MKGGPPYIDLRALYSDTYTVSEYPKEIIRDVADNIVAVQVRTVADIKHLKPEEIAEARSIIEKPRSWGSYGRGWRDDT